MCYSLLFEYEAADRDLIDISVWVYMSPSVFTSFLSMKSVTHSPMGEIMYLSTAVLTVIDWMTEIKEGRELNRSVIEREVD